MRRFVLAFGGVALIGGATTIAFVSGSSSCEDMKP
jgi:hypothetical protein